MRSLVLVVCVVSPPSFPPCPPQCRLATTRAAVSWRVSSCWLDLPPTSSERCKEEEEEQKGAGKRKEGLGKRAPTGPREAGGAQCDRTRVTRVINACRSLLTVAVACAPRSVPTFSPLLSLLYSSTMKLLGAHVLVTGGASGLGAACVRRAVEDGARVSLFDLAGQAEVAAALVAELGGEAKAKYIVTDIVSEESVSKGLAEAVAAFGPLRVVIQCAGVASPCRVISSRGVVHSLNSFSKVVAINLIGTFNVLRLAAAIMAKQEAAEGGERGCFVHVASVAAFEGQIGQAAYSASKGGVAAMTLPLARELGDLGIRINTVS